MTPRPRLEPVRCSSCTEPAAGLVGAEMRPLCVEHIQAAGYRVSPEIQYYLEDKMPNPPGEETAVLQVEFLQADRERQRRLTAELRNDFPYAPRDQAFRTKAFTIWELTRGDAKFLLGLGIEP